MARRKQTKSDDGMVTVVATIRVDKRWAPAVMATLYEMMETENMQGTVHSPETELPFGGVDND